MKRILLLFGLIFAFMATPLFVGGNADATILMDCERRICNPGTGTCVTAGHASQCSPSTCKEIPDIHIL